MSRPPKPATARPSACSICAGRVTSQRAKLSAPPQRACKATPASSSMSAASTCAPSSMKRCAVASPIPEQAPVMNATFFASRWPISSPRGLIADMDRQLYADHALTLALHPSETEERLLVRLLAFALQVPHDANRGALVF